MTRTQINVRLTEERKQRWNDHVEESARYQSVSDFIRQAVNNQIDRDNGGAGGGSMGTQTIQTDGRIDEVLTGINAIQRRVEDLQDVTVSIRETIKADQRQDMAEVLPLVWQTLPEGRENAVKADDFFVQYRGEVIEGVPIQLALERLAEETNSVKRVTAGEEVRWYKESQISEEVSIGDSTLYQVASEDVDTEDVEDLREELEDE